MIISHLLRSRLSMSPFASTFTSLDSIMHASKLPIWFHILQIAVDAERLISCHLPLATFLVCCVFFIFILSRHLGASLPLYNRSHSLYLLSPVWCLFQYYSFNQKHYYIYHLLCVYAIIVLIKCMFFFALSIFSLLLLYAHMCMLCFFFHVFSSFSLSFFGFRFPLQ